MEVNSSQPNIVAGPSQITMLLANKRLAQDVLAFSAPQLPPKRIRNNVGNDLDKNVRAVEQRNTAKTLVMTATE